MLLWGWNKGSIKDSLELAGARNRSCCTVEVPAFLGKNTQYKDIFNSLGVGDSPCDWPVLHQRSDSHLAFYSHDIPNQLYSSQSHQRMTYSQSRAHGASMLSPLLSHPSSGLFCWKLDCSFCFGFRVFFFYFLLEIILVSLLFLIFLLWEVCHNTINSGPRQESQWNHVSQWEEVLKNANVFLFMFPKCKLISLFS